MKMLPFITAVITALLPYISQKTGLSKKYGFKIKMLCAFMYIVTGLLSAFAIQSVTTYSVMILAALCLGFLGDFFLEYKSKKLFPVGAVFFALGHIVYSITFLCVGDRMALTNLAWMIGISFALTVLVLGFAKAKLRLNGKKNLILAYAPILIFSFVCTLVKGSTSVNEGNFSFGLCLISGGVLFFFSDIMIGIGKGGIKRPEFLHYAVSYTYFAAQALFAFSIYFQ